MAAGIQVLDLNEVGELPVYIDGADEANAARQLIKGGGGALTREKIIAECARVFVCIADASETGPDPGCLPIAGGGDTDGACAGGRDDSPLSADARCCVPASLPTTAITSSTCTACHHRPVALEAALNQIPGVVTVGLFAHRPADVLLIGSDTGVKQL